MSPRFSDLTQRIAGRGSVAWDIYYQARAREEQGETIINLAVGDPDLDTPSLIHESAIKALGDGYTHYEVSAGNAGLRTAIARFQSGISRQPLTAENICVFSGGQNALFAASMCLFDHGDEVITSDPCYVTYEGVIQSSGARMVQVPLDINRGFGFDLAAFEAAITPATRGILINFPNNPTGSGLTRQEAESLVNLARDHDLWIISDEVYASIIFEGEFVSPTHVAGGYDKLVVVNSLSKSHAMTGWRVGWVSGPEDFISHVVNLSNCMIFGCPSFIQQAAITALSEDGVKEIEFFRTTFHQRRDLFCDALADAEGLTLFKPSAGMFVMINIAATGLDATGFAQRLLDESGIAILPGPAFGESLTEFVRVGLMMNEESLLKAAEAIKSLALPVQEASKG